MVVAADQRAGRLDWDCYRTELVPDMLTEWGGGHLAQTVTEELRAKPAIAPSM